MGDLSVAKPDAHLKERLGHTFELQIALRRYTICVYIEVFKAYSL